MFSFIQGTLGEPDDDGTHTVMTAGGVGHPVIIPDRDYDKVSAKGKGGDVALFIRTIVKEEEITLYGFLDRDDRRAFDRMIKLDGIGPKTAMKILSKVSWDGFKALVDAKDVKTLCTFDGVGKKTAEKLVTTKLTTLTKKV